MPGNRYNTIQEARVQESTHAGLWLDKYFKDTGENAKKDLVNEIAQTIKTSEVYERFYTQWKQALDENGVVCEQAHVQGRLAINLGAEAVLETSLALHHTYGTPYIPGSALKGLAAHYAMKHLGEKDWSKDSNAFKILFGDTTSAGYVTFFDALYIPGSGYKGQALWPDVITVHHPDYYQSGNTPPADWDNPNPIPLLTATGKFLIALAGPDEWVKAAVEILTLALEEEGIGAKTSSGYGRMKFGGAESASQEPFTLQRKRLLAEPPPTGRIRGTVTNVHISQRYAKINPVGGGKQMFVHINRLRFGGRRIA